jgi:heat shock protein HslJ
MKNLLILLSIFTYLQTSTNETTLAGKWKLQKLEHNDEILIPKKDYFLTFSNELISFNLDVNKCLSRYFTITDTTIIIESLGCTKVCCDGKNDTISNYINYSGRYTIQDEKLIITNQESTIYLNRVK